jgi:hypothetical protein
MMGRDVNVEHRTASRATLLIVDAPVLRIAVGALRRIARRFMAVWRVRLRSVAGALPGPWVGGSVSDQAAVLRALPPAALYDVFAEAANQLLAVYSSMLSTAGSAEEQERLWKRIYAVRDVRYAVRPEEVDRQIELIGAWRRERMGLTAPEA